MKATFQQREWSFLSGTHGLTCVDTHEDQYGGEGHPFCL